MAIIRSYFDYLRPYMDSCPLTNLPTFCQINLQQYNTHFFILFMLTFIRFLFGNNRYLDERYVEFMSKIEGMPIDEKIKFIEARTKKLSGSRRFYDIVMLLSTGVIFNLMASSFSYGLDYFIYFYIVLMCINVIFLIVSVLWNIYADINLRHTSGVLEAVLSLKIFEHEKYPAIWILNNILCMMLFYLLANYIGTYRYVLFLCIFYLNSLIDFYFTWQIYFPPIKRLEAVLDKFRSISEERNVSQSSSKKDAEVGELTL